MSNPDVFYGPTSAEGTAIATSPEEEKASFDHLDVVGGPHCGRCAYIDKRYSVVAIDSPSVKGRRHWYMREGLSNSAQRLVHLSIVNVE